MQKRMELFTYSRKEELANVITHGFGILLSLAGIFILGWRAWNNSTSPLQWLTIVVYWISLLMVYINSTLYHAARKEAAKRIFKILDHISIYFLIAGTTSYFVALYVGGYTAILFLSIQWVLVMAGTIFKLFFTGRFKLLSTLLYMGLGLMVVFIIRTLYINMPAEVFGWIVAGGIFYGAGTLFYLWKRLHFQHAIWHLFVLGGSISHYIALLYSFPSIG